MYSFVTLAMMSECSVRTIDTNARVEIPDVNDDWMAKAMSDTMPPADSDEGMLDFGKNDRY